MAYFETVPRGFFAANETINMLPEAVLGDMVGESLHVLKNEAGVVSYQELHKALQQTSMAGEVSEAQVQSAVNATSFIFRGALIEKLSEAQLEETLIGRTDLSEVARGVFVRGWARYMKEAGEQDAKEATSSLKLPQLVSFDWKLGVGVTSTHSQSLSAPFVSVKMQIADALGAIQYVTVELDMPSFQEMVRALRDMSRQLENV